MFDLMLGLSIEGVECDMLCAAYQEKGFTRVMSNKSKLMVVNTVREVAATMIAPSMVLTSGRSSASTSMTKPKPTTTSTMES